MSAAQKGLLTERRAKKLLIELGYEIDYKIRSRFNPNKDFFHIFDILAIKKKDFVGVQVKTNVSDFYTARKEMKAWKVKYSPPFRMELWLWLGAKGGWRKEEI